MSDSGIDLRSYVSADEARARGKALRDRVPVTARDRAAEGARRPGVLDYIEASNAGRLPHLVPLRIGRMMASPFTFYRGAAGLMAADLAGGPDTGLTAQLCGDAHAANFGLYGTPRGEIIMDINDFDETIAGPWEWDLDRLAASLVLAGRESGAGEDDCRTAAHDAARAYRLAADHLAEQPFLAAWSALPDESVLSQAAAHDLIDDFKKAAKKARKNTSAKVVAKWTEHLEDHQTGITKHRFVSDPPILTPVEDAVAAALTDGLERYGDTLRESRRNLLARFAVSDIAFRIVGTGSVGLHTYVALLHGNADEALVLQLKQARPSALAPYLPAPAPKHEGKRIVKGARLVQSESDILLGWTSVDPTGEGVELPFIVRQFRNMKGSIDPAELSAAELDDYGRLAGALLARAHSRSLDPRLLAGYLGDDERFDDAVADFAVRYADRTESDHAALVDAVERGKIAAEQPD
ncbi:uncharacterized protein (DUF2252 family) [Nocardia tenerifensis]|uniref:Uncharacterized protein (DUF2252 family) n=1 Tax=Nocardia tenerifensis TaxID=228006 RepID=A0A318JTG9_9NOCA|nr:DUF2252 domain-containing protein [Nocardia tenerifensis]PXX58395.1 uncharacterized protein (DUF2252 family) [Nocardia tenerifensis]